MRTTRRKVLPPPSPEGPPGSEPCEDLHSPGSRLVLFLRRVRNTRPDRPAAMHLPEPQGSRMIEILVADITTLHVDAIVNAANSALVGEGGVDGAIHRAAGPTLARAAVALAPCAPGDAVLTSGFALPARYVVHTVGPVWRGGTRDEPAILRSAYERSFAVALAQRDIRSIAFPAISTGIYGFPKELAAAIAMDAMKRHDARFERIIACAFDARTEALYRRTLLGLWGRLRRAGATA